MSTSDDKKKKAAEEEQAHTGSKVAADPLFAEWIARQWTRGEKLQRIDVVQYHSKGPMKGNYGAVRDFKVFSEAHDVNMEEAVDLSNRFLGSCQLDVDRVIKKDATYYARAFDKGRNPVASVIEGGGDPVDTFPIFLRPKTLYVDSSKDDDEVTAQSLALEYLREGTRAYQFDRSREDTNVGDLISMFLSERREQRLWEIKLQEMNRAIMMDWVQAIRDREAALSTELDRLPQRELTKIKAEMLRDGFRAGKNLLTGAFGNMMEKTGDSPATETNSNTQNGTQPNTVVEPRMTQEKLHIDNFIEDCKNAKLENGESARLDIKFFGNWEKDAEGHPQLTEKGIFTPEQFVLLAKVHKGLLRAEALDDLMPGSGKPVAITMEQLGRAQAIPGMTEGIASSLIMLFKIRKQKKDEAATRAAATPHTAPAATTEGSDDV